MIFQSNEGLGRAVGGKRRLKSADPFFQALLNNIVCISLPQQAWWIVTGVWVLCWRRRCPPCLSPLPSEPSLITGATDSTVALASLWAEVTPEPAHTTVGASESGVLGPEPSRAHLAG